MKTIAQLLKTEDKNRSARAIAPDGTGKMQVETPQGVKSVVNATGRSISANYGVMIAGDDNTIIGVDGFRTEPPTVRIRG